METGKINISTVSQNMSLAKTIKDRQAFELFMQKPVKITCDKPKGRLVEENPIQQLGSSVVDTAKDVAALSRALTKGKANDHELGRINSLGQKVGGALIAGALMGSKGTPAKKLMEFIGFGTFFASMSLWPKIAIDLPTKLTCGFDPHAKFIDSYGRKKVFSLDNQYTPWDVWPKEKINEIADKMNVPTDLKDREEYTKEKMRTRMLQGNTLWMLTAPFATPILTSLACNRIENVITEPVSQISLNKVQTGINNTKDLFKAGAEILDVDAVQKVESIFGKLYKSSGFKAQDKEFFKMTAEMRKGLLPESFDARIFKLFDFTSQANGKTLAMNLGGINTESFKPLFNELLAPTVDDISDDFIKAVVGDESEDVLNGARLIFKNAKDIMKAQIKAGKSGSSLEEYLACVVDEACEHGCDAKWVNKIINGTEGLPNEAMEAAKKGVLPRCADQLEKIYQAVIKPTQARLSVCGKQLSQIDNVSGVKYNAAVKTLVDYFNISLDELERLKDFSNITSDPFGDYFVKRFKEVVKDENSYKKLVDKLRKCAYKFETTTPDEASAKATITGTLNGVAQNVKKTLELVLDKVGSGSSELELPSNVTEAIKKAVSKDPELSIKADSISVNALASRLLEMLELEKRINDGTLIEDWNKFAKQTKKADLIKIFDIEKDNLDDFYELCRSAVWKSTYANSVNKYYVTGNGAFFENLTQTLFGYTTDDPKIAQQLEVMRACANSAPCVPNPSLKITPRDMSETYERIANLPHEIKFAFHGEDPIGAIKKKVTTLYYDKTWMKWFSRAAIALVGVTLISQLFFGKVKDAKLYEKKNVEGGNSDGNKQ